MAQSTSEVSILPGWPTPRIIWPDGKKFAFSVFDDPDFQTRERGEPVYDLLADLGIITTKGIFPGTEQTPPPARAVTTLDDRYLAWLLKLKDQGFELGWHGASPGPSDRASTLEGFETYRRHFGDWPRTAANHYECTEAIYWGTERLSDPLHRFAYNAMTRWKNAGAFHGHENNHPQFWGDLCRDRLRYVRNFVYEDINTLAACPFMPYHDPDRPWVNYWYASVNGHNHESFVAALTEEKQDQLESEGGACIMYTHFGYQFLKDGKLQPRFRSLMERLAKKGGWYVPVEQLLDYVLAQRGAVTISPVQRRMLERRWLFYKARSGTA